MNTYQFIKKLLIDPKVLFVFFMAMLVSYVYGAHQRATELNKEVVYQLMKVDHQMYLDLTKHDECLVRLIASAIRQEIKWIGICQNGDNTRAVYSGAIKTTYPDKYKMSWDQIIDVYI